jgi:FkbM family methyltransferase
VYDVGLHDGADTAYYLYLGLRVVAFEAVPTLAHAAAERFAAEIAAGRLQIVNVGISASSGVARFWICDDHSDWSSFDLRIASRNGCGHHAIEIPTACFATLVEEYGVPYYCKIDIEGSDGLCLQALRPDLCPPYISVELQRFPGDDPLRRLSELGYRRFKIIDQTRFCSVEPTIHRLLHAPYPIGPATRELNRVARARLSHHGWRFQIGSSGAIGPATPGRWLGPRAARRVQSWVHGYERNRSLSEWFDLHATL